MNFCFYQHQESTSRLEVVYATLSRLSILRFAASLARLVHDPVEDVSERDQPRV